MPKERMVNDNLSQGRRTDHHSEHTCVKQKDEGVPNKLIRLVDYHGVERALNSES